MRSMSIISSLLAMSLAADPYASHMRRTSRVTGRPFVSAEEQQAKVAAAEAKRNARRAKRLSSIGGIEYA